MEETVLSEKESEQNEKQQETESSQEAVVEEAETQTVEQAEAQAEEHAEEHAAADATPERAPQPVQVPLAPRCENPIVGRKVFFVNPPLYVENYLHLELKQHEYEVYIISDYKYTKNALRRFPDALCFIFVDDEMTYDQWFNFIQSFQKDEKLKTIFVGLMSAIIPKPQLEKFIMNLSLPGGFIMLNEFKGSALIEKIVGILELNGAKGRRKYLRLDCDPSITINGYFANQSQLLQVSIANISSVGFTCYFPRSYGEALKKNMMVPSFSITLGRRSIVTPSVVFDVKVVDANRCFAVMLFLKQVGLDDRKVIKNFIFDQLEKKFEDLIYALPPDVEDYTTRSVKASEEKVEEAGEEKGEAAVEEAEKAEEAETVEAVEAVEAEETESEGESKAE